MQILGQPRGDPSVQVRCICIRFAFWQHLHPGYKAALKLCYPGFPQAMAAHWWKGSLEEIIQRGKFYLFLKTLHRARMRIIDAPSGCTPGQYILSPSLQSGLCQSSDCAMEAADLIQMAAWGEPYMVSFLHMPILGRGRKESRPVKSRLKGSRNSGSISRFRMGICNGSTSWQLKRHRTVYKNFG